MKILVTGGCGYIGTTLIPKLLGAGHKVLSIDNQLFGNFLPKHKNLKNIKMNIGNIKATNIKNVDTVIHLASISNDPSALISSKITWETNVLYTLKLLNLCKEKRIKKFIFASSGSVYGVSKKRKVDENSNLVPISDYNKTKMIGEKLVQSYKKFFDTIILRPGTVCGFSKSLRLDLTVNAMTYGALKNKVINVNGGNQIRPHVHMEDMINAYLFFLKRKNMSGIYNVGFENRSIIKIAKMIKKRLPYVSVKKNKSIDLRSYRLYSKKILKIGFKPIKSTQFAIDEFIENYRFKKIAYSQKSFRANYLKKIIFLNNEFF
jgi:nucleoside-diphosphate-sugar epimerase|tara:strand:- start:65 stop:1021 length:957 start_codon:yes stop_codon:yes gene_type:complete